MPIKPEHFDELLAGYEKPEDLLGEDGLFKQLKKALLERALTFDAVGNLTSDCQRNYTWDAENQLIGITYPGVSGKATAFT